MSPVDNEGDYYALRKTLRDRWCNRMASKYGRTVSHEHGIRIDPVKDAGAEGSGQYLTKVGYELAMTNNKVGRSEGHRTPFAIARDATETGDMADIHLFREWVTASHGKRSITWSAGLRDKFGLGVDKSDKELAAEEQDGETVVEVDPDLWQHITHRRDGTRARLLSAFEIHEHPDAAIAAAVEYLEGLGLGVEVETRSRSGPILTWKPNHKKGHEHHVEHQTH